MDLITDLKCLRKGRGVLAGRVETRIGPALRAVCGITDGDEPTAMRRKVKCWLTDMIGRLPEDLRLTTLTAFALHDDARYPLYQTRVEWVAERVDRDARTVRRRVDTAIDQLAELADTPAGTAAWRTTDLRVVALLDAPSPELLITHAIVAEHGNLREIDVTAPIAWPTAEPRALYGGTLTQRTLTFPAPLPRGAHADYALSLRLPAPPPHVLCVPTHFWDRLDLRVRFPRAARPARVWAVTGSYNDTSGTPHPVDPAGEARLQLRGLVPGLTYGLRW